MVDPVSDPPGYGHIDRAKLDELRALERPGHEGFVARILQAFLTDGGKRLEEIRRGLAAGDSQGVIVAAHTLKGSCSYVGAHQLAALCRGLQELAEQGHLDLGPATADRMERELRALHEVLDIEMRRPPP